ncbi:MAG: hypothetical protein O9972_49535, partial [Burkholderiales bacterium]|nr:hypothetical protein [Burkholderiales bacterium]
HKHHAKLPKGLSLQIWRVRSRSKHSKAIDRNRQKLADSLPAQRGSNYRKFGLKPRRFTTAFPDF